MWQIFMIRTVVSAVSDVVKNPLNNQLSDGLKKTPVSSENAEVIQEKNYKE